jgi:lysophospholipase L1-like esterase
MSMPRRRSLSPRNRRKRLVGAAAAVAGIVLVIGLAWWYSTARSAKLRKTVEAQQRSADLPSCEVQFVGASTLAKWTSISEDLAPLSVANLAVGGTVVSDVALQFSTAEQLALERLHGAGDNQQPLGGLGSAPPAPAIGDDPPQAIVFYAGENDIAFGKSAGQILAGFDGFLTAKRAKYGNTPVYYISIKPSPARWGDRSQQADVNNSIRELAREQSDIRFIDVVPALLRNGRPGPWYVEDGIHLNPEGYAVWAPIVRAALQGEIKRQQTGGCRTT